jgi:hypothetical protein
MDPVISVCIVVGIIALLAIPTWCIRTGYSYGKDLGASEEKRHAADMKVKDFEIADLKALAEKRATIIKDMETHYAGLSKDIEEKAQAIKDRNDILASGGSPADIALKLLHARKQASKDNSGGIAGPIVTAPSGSPS